MMDVVGYATLRPDAEGEGAADMSLFRGKTCRVMEFGKDCVLVLDAGATCLASFDTKHVQSSFRCSCVQEVVCPPGLNVIEQMHYVHRCMERKGGYNRTLRSMVVAASLARGKFTDSFLWERQ